MGNWAKYNLICFFVSLESFLSSSDSASTTGGNKTDLSSSWCVSAHSWRGTNMLMVTTTVRMFHRLWKKCKKQIRTTAISVHLKECLNLSKWSFKRFDIENTTICLLTKFEQTKESNTKTNQVSLVRGIYPDYKYRFVWISYIDYWPDLDEGGKTDTEILKS